MDARVPSPPGSSTGAGSLLDTVVLAQWEDRAELGLFRYDVTACPTKARSRVLSRFASSVLAITLTASHLLCSRVSNCILLRCAAETARRTHSSVRPVVVLGTSRSRSWYFAYMERIENAYVLHVTEVLKAMSLCVQVVPGAFGFIAQFNEGRGSKKRPTEFCVDRVRRWISARAASQHSHRHSTSWAGRPAAHSASTFSLGIPVRCPAYASGVSPPARA